MEKYGLIGEKLGHSFSPMIHKILHNYEYNLYEIEKSNLEEFMKNTNLNGFNVTIPYKQEIIKYCSHISDSAKAIGSVNTVIRNKDGSFSGYNTDYYGFKYLIDKSNLSIKGKKALVLGNGGASKTVQAVLKDCECSQIVVISRKGENNYENIYRHYDAEIIVNSTPVGMYPNNGSSVINLIPFKNCKLILDLIYNPSKTALLLQSEALGIPYFNGLSMLVAQAKKAGELFTKSNTNDNIIEKITNNISKETKNIILIGMPGCGKTTIGKALSDKIGREFIDTDAEIEKYTGITIPEIFSGKLNIDNFKKDIEFGVNMTPEKIFRSIETYILSKVSKESGKIIAAGGGIITIPKNIPLLKQNSMIFLINRSLNELPSEGRPLSKAKGIEALYKERKPLYEKYSDFKVINNDISNAVSEIANIIRA